MLSVQSLCNSQTQCKPYSLIAIDEQDIEINSSLTVVGTQWNCSLTFS